MEKRVVRLALIFADTPYSPTRSGLGIDDHSLSGVLVARLQRVQDRKDK